jgi:hypothetical protein
MVRERLMGSLALPVLSAGAVAAASGDRGLSFYLCFAVVFLSMLYADWSRALFTETTSSRVPPGLALAVATLSLVLYSVIDHDDELPDYAIIAFVAVCGCVVVAGMARAGATGPSYRVA